MFDIPVFVYGSLKENFHNHDLIVDNSEFVGEYLTKDDYYIMYSQSGSFPLVTIDDEDDSRGKMLGELFYVDEEGLDMMDILEGHPDFYRRRKIKLDNTDIMPYCYIIDNDESVFGKEPIKKSDNLYIWEKL